MNTNTESNTEAKSKLTTLFGGEVFSVTCVDGNTETVWVSQLRLVEYQKALPLAASEFDITAFCCSKNNETPRVPCTTEWVMRLSPKSYEGLRSKVQEVNNEGFFIYAARKAAEDQAIQLAWVKQAAELPPEVLKAAIQAGKSALPTSSPKPR